MKIRAKLLQRLIAFFVACIVVAFGGFAPMPARAQAGLPTESQAYSNCVAYVAQYYPGNSNVSCADKGKYGGNCAVYMIYYGSQSQSFNYDCGTAPPSNPCSVNAPQLTGLFPGKITSASTWCKANVPTGVSNQTTSCTMSFVPSGPPTATQWGSWNTPGTLSASGATCTGDGGGQNTWKGASGAALNPAPPTPDVAPPVSPAPKACDGGSCYDPSADQFCATTGGSQFCVPGSQARSAGACASSGDSAICAGSPPPNPPSGTIADPGSAITHSDTYTQADKNTGATQSITVNTFTNPGGKQTTNGQSTGDSGPASSSSTGGKGDGTTSSGGGDCNTPPIVQGSGGMSAIAYQTWKTRCDIEKQGGNNLGTGTVNGLGTLYTPSGDTTQSVVADFQATVQQAPIANAVTGFFAVGTTGGSCPTWTLAATDWNPEETFDFYCRPEAGDALDMARIVLLIVCAYVAFQIAMGDS